MARGVILFICLISAMLCLAKKNLLHYDLDSLFTKLAEFGMNLEEDEEYYAKEEDKLSTSYYQNMNKGLHHYVLCLKESGLSTGKYAPIKAESLANLAHQFRGDVTEEIVEIVMNIFRDNEINEENLQTIVGMAEGFCDADKIFEKEVKPEGLGKSAKTKSE